MGSYKREGCASEERSDSDGTHVIGKTGGDHPPCYSVARIDAESIHSEVTAREAEEQDDSVRACVYKRHLT